jgi:hypothetical protein
MTLSSFTAIRKSTGRSVTVSGCQVLYSTEKQSWTHEASGYAEAVQAALLWLSRTTEAGAAT